MAGHLLVQAAMAYLGVGVALGVVFLVFVIDRIDASAHGAFAFRPLLLPGLTLLWPLVLVRVAAKWQGIADAAPRQRGHLRAHRWAWALLAVVIPAALAGGLALRVYHLPAPASVRLGDAP